MTIAVIGTGYVGLVSAACLAELGHEVVGVDIDEKKVKMLQEGKSPIFEPGLEELLTRGLKEKRLSFTTDLASILPDIDVAFTAVATPPGEGHKADLKAVFAVTETVARNATHDLVLVNKSTVPVGTGKECEKRIAEILKGRGESITIPVVSNPEFLREGMAVTDTLMPERIVVGVNGDPTVTLHGKETTATEVMEELFRPITRVGKPLVTMSRESAELVKYASNAFLATKISFANMMSELAEKTGANVRDVAKGMGLDSRIGPRFLHAGIGYGGSCFPKDVQALMATAKEYGLEFSLIEATEKVNIHQRQRFLEKVLSSLPKNATVGVWGLSFKPKTDDMREAPSLDIVPALLKDEHTVRAFDPAAMENSASLLPQEIEYCTSALEAAKDADAVVLLTEWDVFRGIDLEKVADAMKGVDVFDGRNVYDPAEVQEAGLRYHGIGIP